MYHNNEPQRNDMLREEIKKMCLENTELFAELCIKTEKKPNACLQFLNRNSSMELRSFEVLGIIKKHTGLTELEILEPLHMELSESDANK